MIYIKQYTNSNKCPYCGSDTYKTTAAEIYNNPPENRLRRKKALACSNSKCKSYCIYDENDAAFPGVVANKYLRELRTKTHLYIDTLYLTKLFKNRTQMYMMLSEELNIKLNHTHVRYFGIVECMKAMLISAKIISERFEQIKTFEGLSKDQLFLLSRIVKCDFNKLSNTEFRGKELIPFFSLFVTDGKNVRVVSVNLIKDDCTVYKYGSSTTFSINGTTIEDYIFSFGISLYNDYAKNSGYNTI